MSRRAKLVAAGLVIVAAVACTGLSWCARRAPSPQAAGSATALPAASRAPVAALCEHQVPAELCTQCNPDLAAVFQEAGDWCAEHGLPRSQCRKCDPGLTFAAAPAAPSDWCREHAVPESKCTLCHPRLVAKFVAAGDYCREHGYPLSVCPVCRPELARAHGAAPPAFPEPGTRVRLASAETAGEAGLETARVEVRPFGRALEVVGQLRFEPNRHAELSARGDSLVLQVPVSEGDEVRAGQALVVLASSAVGAEQARLVAAKARVETAQTVLARETMLAAKRVNSRRDVEDARRELAAAVAERDSALAGLRATGASPTGSGGRYSLLAPFAGTVVTRAAAPGMTAAAGQVLVELADVRSLIAELDVPEADATLVRPGQQVELTLEGGAASFEGRIASVAAVVDPQSRTVRARVRVDNEDRRLRAGLFVRARIRLEAARSALLVPSRAVQYVKGQPLVFIRKEPTLYEPVGVKLGAAEGGLVEVLAGVSPGVDVVTTGAFLLKTEILKESIGAGCCEEAPGS